MIDLSIIGAVEPLALEGGARMAVAIIYGIFLGLILVKCDFADRMEVKKNLTFHSMKMSKILLLALALGMLAFALLRDYHVIQPQISEANFWGVLAGGVCVGIGLGMNGLVPITAVAALASGRLYVLWMLLGMALAFPAAKFLKDNLSSILSRFDSSVSASLEPANGIFAMDSPALWVSIIAFLLCMIMQFFGVKDDAK